MTKHRDLAYGQALPEAVLDAMMELLGTYVSGNFTVTQVNSTTLRVPASAGNGQVAMAVNGRWRYNVANADAIAPAGSAAIYTLWITGSDNNFAAGPPEVDNTVYAFGLEIRASGTPAAAISRQIGTVDWNGTAIRSYTLSVGSANDTRNPGEFIASAGVNLFPNCLLADGSAVSRATYARLFAQVGTTWGAGDGSTTFNLPNCLGRGLIGAGSSGGAGLTARTLGSTGGAETVALAIGDMPAHDHGGSTAAAAPSGSLGSTTDTGTIAANTATGTVAAASATGTLSTHAGHKHSLNAIDGSAVANLTLGFVVLGRGGAGVSSTRLSYEGTAGAGAITNDYTGNDPPLDGTTDTGGSHTHTFTPTAHAHSFTGDAHAHTLTMNAHTHSLSLASHSHTISSQGSGTAHANMQPWAGVTWMVHI